MKGEIVATAKASAATALETISALMGSPVRPPFNPNPLQPGGMFFGRGKR